ncbi:uncharacterized protein LOC123615488 [Camelus bactrianus]|uniref:Uncharacterized protein LOC123615488 n=1 Tax=Camelus bactrianus TaxID=9837 RepID=A0AC58QYD3_CAMBA
MQVPGRGPAGSRRSAVRGAHRPPGSAEPRPLRRCGGLPTPPGATARSGAQGLRRRGAAPPGVTVCGALSGGGEPGRGGAGTARPRGVGRALRGGTSAACAAPRSQRRRPGAAAGEVSVRAAPKRGSCALPPEDARGDPEAAQADGLAGPRRRQLAEGVRLPRGTRAASRAEGRAETGPALPRADEAASPAAQTPLSAGAALSPGPRGAAATPSPGAAPGPPGERPDSRPHQAKQEQGFGCLSSVWRRESGGEPASSPSQLPGPPAFPTCGPSVFKAATCSLCALFCHHNSLSRPQRERFCL